MAGDPMNVIRMPNGGLTPIDNTRVVAVWQAGIDVQARQYVYLSQGIETAANLGKSRDCGFSSSTI